VCIRVVDLDDLDEWPIADSDACDMVLGAHVVVRSAIWATVGA
jgi:hypothetical protein